MEDLAMIGIKNNNNFFRISVAAIMLLSILGFRIMAMLSMAFFHMNSTLVTIEQGG